ncbi:MULTISPECIES: hypothetical protein [Paraburkholderia]|uniref:hypothetical protein n=1 Tax=Paraburkholderia TaxID=1822464 RepID=UPI0013A6AB3B|nr:MULTISPECIES: hypothetical protein [Paraburkholderia]
MKVRPPSTLAGLSSMNSVSVAARAEAFDAARRQVCVAGFAAPNAAERTTVNRFKSG